MSRAVASAVCPVVCACVRACRREQFLSRPDLFKQIHLHTDVRLALGWAGVFVAAGTAFYGWKVDFEQSKPVMWVGLVLCVLSSPLCRVRACSLLGLCASRGCSCAATSC